MSERSDHDGKHVALDKHFEPLPRRPGPRSKFDMLVLAYLGLKPRDGRDGMRDGRRAAIIRALGYQVPWSAIRHWRRGYRRPPRWAIDMLIAKSRERSAELHEAARDAAPSQGR